MKGVVILQLKPKIMLLGTQLTNGNNYLLADADGAAAYVVETTGGNKSVRTSRDLGENGYFLITTKFFLTDEMQISQPSGYEYSKDRYNQLFNTLTEYAGSIDFEFAKLILRTPPVCRGIAGNRNQHITIYEEGIVPKGYICTGTSNWMVSSIPKGAPIEPTYSFYELVLEEKPADVVLAAEKTAREYMGKAMAELNKLSDSDIEYFSLNEKFSEAKAEYHKGRMAREVATLIEGYGFEAKNQRLINTMKHLLSLLDFKLFRSRFIMLLYHLQLVQMSLDGIPRIRKL